MSAEQRELLSRWSQGDGNAGQRFMAHFLPTLRRFFATRAPRDADDLVQQTALSILEHAASASQATSVRAYCLRCARHRLIDSRRRTKATDPVPSVLTAGRTTPSQAVSREQLAAAVRQCLTSLPPRLRPPLELHYFDGLQVAEIADVLEIPVGTAKTRLRNARAKFALQFRKQFGGLDVVDFRG